MNPSELPPQRKETSEVFERAVVDTDGSRWAEIQEDLIARYKHIVAFRGAGTISGIDKKEADRVIEEELIPRLRSYIENGGVAVLYDGDEDNLDQPDIGFILGRLMDQLGDESGVEFVAAQKQSWYYPQKEGGNLTNASGREFKTVVFEDGTFPGDHNSFTQSERLANVEGYEQWYVGAAGAIGSAQLEDLNAKVVTGRRKAVLFRARLNEELTGSIQANLTQAREAGDTTKVERLEQILQSRQNSYGAHFDSKGSLKLDPSHLEHLELEVV